MLVQKSASKLNMLRNAKLNKNTQMEEKNHLKKTFQKCIENSKTFKYY